MWLFSYLTVNLKNITFYIFLWVWRGVSHADLFHWCSHSYSTPRHPNQCSSKAGGSKVLKSHFLCPTHDLKPPPCGSSPLCPPLSLQKQAQAVSLAQSQHIKSVMSDYWTTGGWIKALGRRDSSRSAGTGLFPPAAYVSCRLEGRTQGSPPISHSQYSPASYGTVRPTLSLVERSLMHSLGFNQNGLLMDAFDYTSSNKYDLLLTLERLKMDTEIKLKNVFILNRKDGRHGNTI